MSFFNERSNNHMLIEFSAVVASTLRLWQSIKGELTIDTSWKTYPAGVFVANYLIVWGGIEAAAVILCGCFPTFPRFFLHVKSLCHTVEELNSVGPSGETIGSKRLNCSKKTSPTESELRAIYARDMSFTRTDVQLSEMGLYNPTQSETQKMVKAQASSANLTIRTFET